MAGEEEKKLAPPQAHPAMITPVTPKLTITLFREFLAEKAPRFSCSACQTNTFGVMQFFSPDSTSSIPLFVANESHPQTGFYYSTFGTICHNCGHIDLFFANVIDAWMNAREASSQDKKQ